MKTYLNPNTVDGMRLKAFLTDGDPLRIDISNSAVTYTGYAIPGTLDTDAAWLIKKTNVVGTITYIGYANGEKMFNQVWHDRATLDVGTFYS
jgi:uncharacterized protein (UPF0303 family)